MPQRSPTRVSETRSEAFWRSVVLPPSATSTVPPVSRRYRLMQRGRAEVLWGFAFFVVGQLLLACAMQVGWPELRDPEYGRRLNALRARRAEEPNRPLVLALGSSRLAMGLRPDMLLPLQPDDPLPFNFALVGSGPVTQLLCLHRLLADGIEPDGLLLEIWPPLLHPGMGVEVNRLDPRRLEARDLPLLIRYGAAPDHLEKHWWRSRVIPAFEHRLNLMSQFLPSWLPYNYRQDTGYRGLDAWGWLPNKRPTKQYTNEELQRLMEPFRQQYAPLVADFQVAETADRAVHELLDLCRTHRIAAAFILMPEGSVVRGWYSAASWQRIEAYLQRLRHEYDIPFLNARHWVADDGFRDGYHLHADGAADFTRRFLQAGGWRALDWDWARRKIDKSGRLQY